MHEDPASIPDVFRIGAAPVQPPCQTKAGPEAPTGEPNLHVNKNQKKNQRKKERKKEKNIEAAAIAARAEQSSHFEEHRQTVCAPETSKPASSVLAAIFAANPAWAIFDSDKKGALVAAEGEAGRIRLWTGLNADPRSIMVDSQGFVSFIADNEEYCLDPTYSSISVGRGGTVFIDVDDWRAGRKMDGSACCD